MGLEGVRSRRLRAPALGGLRRAKRRRRKAVGVPWMTGPNDPPYANDPALCVSACAELRCEVLERATQCARGAGTGGGPLLDPY